MKEKPNLRIQLNGPDFLFGLDNLAQCLLALHNQHQLHFVQQNTGILDENEVRLRVSTFENSHNQLIIDLTPSLPNALPFDENYDTFIEFFKTLSRTYAYFLGDCTERRDFKPRDLKNYYNILEPAARDGESVDFSVINSKEPIEPFSLSSRQARAAQESIIEYESKLKEPTSSFHEDCVLNWYQTRNDPKSKLGDKSIIERLDPRPVKTVCLNESIKKSLLSSADNPFHFGYLVDIETERVQGKYSLYKIEAIKQKLSCGDPPIELSLPDELEPPSEEKKE